MLIDDYLIVIANVTTCQQVIYILRHGLGIVVAQLILVRVDAILDFARVQSFLSAISSLLGLWSFHNGLILGDIVHDFLSANIVLFLIVFLRFRLIFKLVMECLYVARVCRSRHLVATTARVLAHLLDNRWWQDGVWNLRLSFLLLLSSRKICCRADSR